MDLNARVGENYERKDGQTDGWTDVWTDGRTENRTPTSNLTRAGATKPS